MKIASRVLKTRDPIETRAFKTRFTRFVSPLMWTNFATWSFQTPTHTVSLSSNTLSVSQTLSLNLSNNLRVQTPKSIKRSPSNAHRPQRATKITLTVNTEISQKLTVKHSPSSACNENHSHCQTLFSFLKPHSDDPLTHTLKIPFVPTSDFALFEGMFFL